MRKTTQQTKLYVWTSRYSDVRAPGHLNVRMSRQWDVWMSRRRDVQSVISSRYLAQSFDSSFYNEHFVVCFLVNSSISSFIIHCSLLISHSSHIPQVSLSKGSPKQSVTRIVSRPLSKEKIVINSKWSIRGSAFCFKLLWKLKKYY